MASTELNNLVQMLRANNPLSDASVADMRAGMEAMTALTPLPEGTLAEAFSLEGIPAEWVAAPDVDSKRTVLYLHGGGYVIGSINTHRGLAARISADANARCLLIDYRLAPENPFPAAVEDGTAAYRWLLAQGFEAEKLAIAGDSAGGGLTVATLVALRDAGDALPAAAVCLSPWVDLEGLGESMTTRADEDPMVARDGLLSMAEMYLGGADARTPLAAPLYANLGSLPPLLIQVGTAETLLDDSIRLAERAKREGVDVTLDVWQELIHVFQAFAPALPEANQAIEQIGEFLNKRLA
ncbi:MAG: alpha/beta hydrolase [bacterium]|nr:alpha/beta hydrolase [bacterium]